MRLRSSGVLNESATDSVRMKIATAMSRAWAPSNRLNSDEPLKCLSASRTLRCDRSGLSAQ